LAIECFIKAEFLVRQPVVNVIKLFLSEISTFGRLEEFKELKLKILLKIPIARFLTKKLYMIDQ